ncbi:glycosyltransferase family 4 protein [Aureliella helgolandensis]|uniref:Glycosyl transferases group 1 n=1 Tax=Aureliella helgolandensis TaxID=2527968 RepID=A0A518G7Y6_9BACT|nr:glycosyltransferase family 4 protein [Aureliella helgolandensis]QDV24708.1 Glycosyl transferases group 1 [Aureliella helgolandensis]
MGDSQRVLILTRQFWPQTTDATLRLSDWAVELHQQGHRVHILSPRWHRSWPNRVQCLELPIQRIDAVPTSPLRVGKYLRAVADYIERECRDFDWIYCDSAEHEASACFARLPPSQRPPVVVRFDPPELHAQPDLRWQPSTMALEVCRKADLVIAPHAAAHQRLLSLGIVDSKILRAASFVARPIDRSKAARRVARQILSEINHDLFIRSTDRVVVCPGELSDSWNVELLIRALAPVIDSQRALRLWILGDGTTRGRYYEALRDRGIHHLVAMPGIFTELTEILQVADLCVFPAAGNGLSWLIPTCMASGLPFLSAESPTARRWLGEHASLHLFTSQNEAALRENLERWWSDPSPYASSAIQLQRNYVAHATKDPLLAAIGEHLKLNAQPRKPAEPAALQQSLVSENKQE